MIRISKAMVVFAWLVLFYASFANRLRDPEALLLTNFTMLLAIFLVLWEIAEKLS